VRGREDHGWVVGLGVEGVEGFLRDEEVRGEFGQELVNEWG
jgi:hypothetical protein